MNRVTHHIACLSPTGTTRRVAGVIAEALGRSGCRAEVLDLGGDGRDVEPSEWLRGVSGPACVWIGSPVYALHPIPQVSRFVAGLPVLRRGIAVPFVTGYLASHPTINPFGFEATLFAHVMSANLIFILIPLTKLSHMVLLPTTQMVAEVGWHFPARSGKEVCTTLGKEGRPI